jgi:FkbM family methyltransferase
MTTYWNPQFLKHLLKDDIKVIFEVGARYGDESIMLSNTFDSAQIYSFECNPNTLMKCIRTLKKYEKIKFFPHGLGEKKEILPFYSHNNDNDGASSLHKRIDFDTTQKFTGSVIIKTLETIMAQQNLTHIDLLCMDIQGHELSVLKGAGKYLKNIKYIIMEEPKPRIYKGLLPEGVHSKYLDIPTSAEIKEYMTVNGFIEVERLSENLIEDNVMYKRIIKDPNVKRFFNIDLHISVIADIKDIFRRIRPDIEIVDWSLSGHAWIFNKIQSFVKVIDKTSWLNLNLSSIKEFQDIYDEFLSGFDGFIACHPNSFSMLFEKYNKPIIVVNSCRYDLPFCWNKNIQMVEELHNCFRRLQDKKLLYFVSNNRADNAYFKLGNPEIHTQLIPSLCLYTNMNWVPSVEQEYFLVYSGNIPDNRNIKRRSDLEERYSWDALMNFKGIIHIPYEASTMSIFEQISSGIPLFFPTKEFLYRLWNSGENCGVNYWVNPPDYLYPTKDKLFWIEKADYYNIEGIYYFNSFEELFNMIESFTDTHYERRLEAIKTRYNKVLQDYTNILANF